MRVSALEPEGIDAEASIRTRACCQEEAMFMKVARPKQVKVINKADVRAIVSFVWRECRDGLKPEDQPQFYLTLDDLVQQAVERRVHEELHRRLIAMPSRN